MGSTITVPISLLVQLYAPLAGLLGMAIWLGMLSQRQKDDGTEWRRRMSKAEKEIDELKKDVGAVAVLAAQFTALSTSVAKIERATENVRHTLANIVSGKANTTLIISRPDDDR